MEGRAAGRLRETEFLGEVRRGAVIIDNHFTDLPKITVEQALKELENHSKVEDPTHNQHPSSQETLLPSRTDLACASYRATEMVSEARLDTVEIRQKLERS